MNDVLQLRLTANRGVVSSGELAAAGYDRHGVRALVQRRELVRVRSGAFVAGAAFAAADAATRHVLSSRAVVRRLDGYAVSHITAVAVWELPVLAADLGLVHLAPIGSGRARTAGLLRLHPAVSPLDVSWRLGVRCVRGEVAVLQTAELSMRAALIAADAAVRGGLTTRADLVAQVHRRGLGYAASQVADLAHGLSESPGESWTSLVLAGLGVEAEQQAVIRDASGRFVARVDFLLRDQRVVVEFDGAVKYAGAAGRDELVREKAREDALRALGYRVVRLTWADLQHPERVLAKLGLASLHR